ncbi:hypothetical protein O7627_08010 [Solwaraspora sp. WMMD1047]|uniref:hypothetical protein n=1 Tax=Solwaraspora sp. WMMD1047 TaxID=3016102 RepID=UPI0024180854|nr:hypothetical protein [Solwaraspora sp. WMMD1047]MDG4829250.1 hypothetical protein [Solwaraspora sp. WMMD1047]
MRSRFVRATAGLLLLTIGLPMLLAGGGLWLAGRHRDAGGSFSASLERISSPGYAVVVSDLDALLRREAPFTRTGPNRLRITGRTGQSLAFLGIAPADAVARYLAPVPHARIERVRVTRGALPSRIEQVPADPPPSGGPAVGLAPPGDRTFWVSHGDGVLDLAVSDLRDRGLSLVVMRPDGGPGLAADLRAELRPGWLDPGAVAALAAGALLMILGMAALAWPVRPREIVFVVEPSQVPVLAGRLGVPAFSDLGHGPASRAGRWGVRPAGRRSARPGQRPTTGPGPAVGLGTGADPGAGPGSAAARRVPGPATAREHAVEWTGHPSTGVLPANPRYERPRAAKVLVSPADPAATPATAAPPAATRPATLADAEREARVDRAGREDRDGPVVRLPVGVPDRRLGTAPPVTLEFERPTLGDRRAATTPPRSRAGGSAPSGARFPVVAPSLRPAVPAGPRQEASAGQVPPVPAGSSGGSTATPDGCRSTARRVRPGAPPAE